MPGTMSGCLGDWLSEREDRCGDSPEHPAERQEFHGVKGSGVNKHGRFMHV